MISAGAAEMLTDANAMSRSLVLAGSRVPACSRVNRDQSQLPSKTLDFMLRNTPQVQIKHIEF
jgi:hypothetical protein